MHEITDAVVTYLRRVAAYDTAVVVVQLMMIALVVWLVMRFLRGTRGARLVKGAILLLAMIFVAIRLLPGSDDWRRIEFLYSQFLWFAFIAFVVAFQPELRRALISIGQARIFHTRRSEIEDIVEELIRSLAYLSRNKIGAIFAIERSVGLGSLIGAGTVLNADLSAELLNTIFYPGSPLHDMGVILHEGRIAAAGCQFPLAESEEVDPSLGSRHRAALGLAKESDALVLVVSEETGRIALAYEAQLYIGMPQEAVREMLMELLAPAVTRRQRKDRKEERTA
ncbi:MAG: diadenylate cyclase CdaA [Phycisphaerae bacterium]|nr:diadenylate cyclase CdaA [Phycisphaerae bacterium]